MRKKFIILLLVSAFLCSCAKSEGDVETAENFENTEDDVQQEGNAETQGKAAGGYLSITETRWDNGTDSSGGMTTMELCYDLDNGVLEEVGGVSYTSQYPLAVYSRGDDVIYFTADEESGHNRDQVYCLDRKTGDVYRLTEGLFAINYIIPAQDQIILVAVSTEERILRPYIYEKATGELYKVEVYEDFNIKYCSYNPITERVFVGGFLDSENYAMGEEFCDYVNKNGLDYFTTPATPTDGYIFELTDEYKTPKLVLQLKEQGVEKGLPSDEAGNLYLQLSFTSPMARFDPMTESKVLNTAAGELTDSDYFDELPLTISSYTKYGEDYYILGVGYVENSPYPRGIYRYRPGERPELIYQAAENGFINQFTLCRDAGETSLDLEKAEKVQLEAADTKNIFNDSAEHQLEDFVLALPDENGIVESKLVPSLMQAGSAIYFIDETHFVILQGGLYYDTQEKVEETRQEVMENNIKYKEQGVHYMPFSRPCVNSLVVYDDIGDNIGSIYHVYLDISLEEAEKKAKEWYDDVSGQTGE